MRPLSLILTAFGPFCGSETIDFTALGDNTLFLINGPTGSGKTTILDGICFALYGKTTGDEREGAQMRCDLTASEVLTEVCFEFELAGRRFRIRRMPEQERPKSRGEGTTTQSPEAQLVELLADGKENLLVASKVSEATREIEELTGLSVDQFRQVMVLPQGKFRQLLMADSSEREKIFSQLFQTRIYKRLEENLKARAASIRQERERQLQLQQGMLEGADLESCDGLEKELAELEPSTAAARAALANEEAALGAADKAHEQARTLLEEFTRLKKVMTELQQLELQKDQIGSDRQRLQQAERALTLQPLFTERLRCAAELRVVKGAVDLAVEKKAQAGERLRVAAEQQVMGSGLQKDLDQAKQQSAQLAGYTARADKE